MELSVLFVRTVPHADVLTVFHNARGGVCCKSEGNFALTSMASFTQAAREASKLVVACLDGRRVKGYVFNFSPLRERFRLFPEANSAPESGADVELADLKALFFVKNFAGNPQYKEHYESNGGRGRRLEVTFKDGEKIIGTTEGWSPQKLGFFLFPADAKNNNLRIFVVNRNMAQVRLL
jgi:hypothetical protein